MTNTNSDMTLVVIGDDHDVPLNMHTGPDVFQPYGETGMLWPHIVEELNKKESLAGLKFAEFGAGTGAYAVMTKKYYPDLDVYAYDNDPNAEKYMVANAELHNVDININIQDVADIPNSEKFDYIYSSPPVYPDTLASSGMHGHGGISSPNKNDPASAMFSGENGLATQTVFVEKAGNVLNEGGTIFVFHTLSQIEQVEQLLESNGFTVDRVENQQVQTSDLDPIFTIAYKN